MREYIDRTFKRLEDYILKSIEKDVILSGIKTSPYFIAKLLTTSMVILPLVLIVSYFIISCTYKPLLLTLALTSPILLTYLIKLWLKMLINVRGRRVSDELRLFSTYASMLHEGGVTLYDAFKRILNFKVFPWLEKEASRIVRNVEILGMDPLNALEEVAKNCPSKEFRDYIFNYTAIVHSGGDPSRYLEEEAKTNIRRMIEHSQVYSDRVMLFGELIIGVLVLSAMLLGVMVAITPSSAYDLLLLHMLILTPMITFILWIIIEVNQPRLGTQYKPSRVIIALAITLATLPPTLLYLNPLTLSASLSLLFLTIGADYVWLKRRWDSEEAALESMLREVVEYRKMGYTPLQALERIYESRSYNKWFDKLIGEVIFKIRAGIKPSMINVESSSWIVRMVFKILGDVEDAGGGTPVVLEELYKLVEELRSIKRRVSTYTKVYEILSYMTPLLLAFSSALTLSMIEIISSYNLVTLIPVHQIGLVKLLLEYLILVSSVSIALLMGKVSDYTIASCFKSGVVMTIATVSIAFLNDLVNMIVGTLV